MSISRCYGTKQQGSLEKGHQGCKSNKKFSNWRSFYFNYEAGAQKRINFSKGQRKIHKNQHAKLLKNHLKILKKKYTKNFFLLESKSTSWIQLALTQCAVLHQHEMMVKKSIKLLQHASLLVCFIFLYNVPYATLKDEQSKR